jgi:hypothetical protein
MKVVKVICALLICGFVSVSHAAVIFITEKDTNGNVTSLLGADNVQVNGLFYNVRFQDGTCIDLFNGCDEASDFLFNSEETAGAAADALLAQVFFEGGQFLTRWTLIAGCGFAGECLLLTPRGFVGTGAGLVGELRSCVVGLVDDGGSRTCNVITPPMFDTGQYNDIVYAVWTEAVEASAPGTAMILLMGIAGLLVSRRRKHA